MCLFLIHQKVQLEYHNKGDYRNQVSLQDTAAQIKWLTNALQNSKATWKIVVGHHPLYSAGKRKGKTQDMENRFKHIFNTYKVDAYLSGHEHHLEYDKIDSDYFHHFISGSGSEVRSVSNALYAKFVDAEAGIFSFSINKKSMLVQAINQYGKVIFEKLIKK